MSLHFQGIHPVFVWLRSLRQSTMAVEPCVERCSPHGRKEEERSEGIR